jgi:hypothetical protein
VVGRIKLHVQLLEFCIPGRGKMKQKDFFTFRGDRKHVLWNGNRVPAVTRADNFFGIFRHHNHLIFHHWLTILLREMLAKEV